jgi:hypothetical protein
MAKSRRARRAKNNIAGSSQQSLTTADPAVEPILESAIVVQRPTTVWVTRDSLFNAELEAAIDIIARDRVYRATLARLGRRLLIAPTSIGDGADV